MTVGVRRSTQIFSRQHINVERNRKSSVVSMSRNYASSESYDYNLEMISEKYVKVLDIPRGHPDR